jgi:hypothetical protein
LIEDLPACTEAWRTLDCEALVAGEVSSCVTPGERELGEACLFATQCQSGLCSVPGSECGVCEQVAGETDDCTLPGFICRYGMRCGAAKRCEPEPVPEPPPPIEAGSRPLGESCTKDADCVSPYECIGQQNSATRICGELADLGEPCADSASCKRPNMFCAEVSRVCETQRDVAEPCSVEVGTDRGGCVAGLACDRSLDPPLCAELPVEGEACIFVPLLSGYVCDFGLTCELSLEPPECRIAAEGEPDLVRVTDAGAPVMGLPGIGPSAPVGGESCTEERRCAPPFQCLCTSPECDARVCAIYALPGESCSNSDRLCVPASRCEDAICVLSGRPSEFETRCE